MKLFVLMTMNNCFTLLKSSPMERMQNYLSQSCYRREPGLINHRGVNRTVDATRSVKCSYNAQGPALGILEALLIGTPMMPGGSTLAMFVALDNVLDRMSHCIRP